MAASPRPAGGRDFEVVQKRARAAIEEARRTVARSEVLAEAMDLQRGDQELLVRCAWCGRYGLGAEWMEDDELPLNWALREKIQTEEITHSICPSCAAGA